MCSPARAFARYDRSRPSSARRRSVSWWPGFDVEEPTPTEADLADLREWTARLRSVFEPQPEQARAELTRTLVPGGGWKIPPGRSTFG